MKGKIRELEGITYDTSDAEQKKAYSRHYHRLYKRNQYKTHKEVVHAYNKNYVAKNREKVNAYYRDRYANLSQEQKQLTRETNRIFANNKYKNDAEYREKHKQATLARYYKKKEKS
jgi:translation initiation factor IF-2